MATMASTTLRASRIRLSTHTRAFHLTIPRNDLVGPPDPISNLRPVVYDDAPPPPPSAVRHPYSLKEFTGDTREYQWKILRQELDAYNYAFWTDSNTRFHTAKEAFLSGLPESASEEDKENALSDFYRGWLIQEEPRQKAYTAEWQKRNKQNILLGARLQYQKFMARLGFSSASQ